MEKNEKLRLTITDMTTDGEGVGHADGCALFVKDAIIGDTADVVITKMKKNYGYARMLEIAEPSKDRIPEACPLARPCGGCQLQAMNYQAQLEWKREKVRRNLEKIGGLTVPVEPTVGMDDPFRYRNKTQLPVGYDRNGKLAVGFYAGRTHSLIAQEDCLLAPEENAAISKHVLSWMEKHRIAPYDESTGKGLIRHILIRKGFTSGEIMVCLIANGEQLPHVKDLIEKLSHVDGMKSICLNVNKKRNNVILGDATRCLWGSETIEDEIGGIRFEISPRSFFQVNPVQTEKLYGKALEFADLTGEETVWDLYCGIGSISLFLAQKARKVYGVEIVPEAIDDAKKNAARNGFSNTEFFVGKSEEVLPAWRAEQRGRQTSSDQSGKVDVIVTDPPRKGCEESLLHCMLEMEPKRIVYVSCDSATLARDLKILTAGGYEIEKVQPVDMFPHTGHVETVCLLTRKAPV